MDSKTLNNNKLIQNVKNIFVKILNVNVNELELHDSFFSLGGDSLRLINLYELIQRNFGISINTRLLYKHNSVAGIVKLIAFTKRHPRLNNPMKQNALITTSNELSFEQKQIWIAHNVSDNKSIYNIPWIVKINGNLDESKISLSLEKIVLEHELFRCGFKHNKDYIQVRTYNYTPFNFRIIECEENLIDEKISETINAPFDLENPPLYCFRLFKTYNRYTLCCVFHHIIIDSRSLEIFSDLISKFYKNSRSEINYQPYKRYVDYQKSVFDRKIPSAKVKFWKSKLKNNDHIIKIPTFNQFRPHQSNKNNICEMSFDIDNEILNKAKIFSNQNNFTIFPFLFSIFSIAISRLVDKNNFYISLPVSTRMEGDFADTLGLFITLLPHKTTIKANSKFISHLHTTAQELIQLYQNGYVPHASIQEYSELSHDDFKETFNIAFTHDVEFPFKMDGLKTQVIPSSYIGYKFDLTFFIKENPDFPRVLIEFNPNKFSKTVITSIFNAFCYVAEYVLSNPDSPINEIPLTQPDKFSVAGNNEKPNHNSILHRFSEVAKKYPVKVAIENNGSEISYQDLDIKSSQFANYLRNSGFVSGDKIAIYMKHSIELIICILGILKNRCAYVPIHPSTPKDRIHYYVNQSNAKTVIIDTIINTDWGLHTINVNSFLDNIQQISDKWNNSVNTDDLAYIIFTSGSTGQPKGVMVNHANLINLFYQSDKVFSFDENDNWVLFHSYSFDFSVWEIFGALLNGAKLIIPDQSLIKSPEHFYDLIINKNITVLNQTPTAFSLFSAHAIRNVYNGKLPLKYIIFGGEAINIRSIMNWLKCFPIHNTKLVNMYGITEGTVHVTYCFIDDTSIISNDYGTPIGIPLDGNGIILLDRHGLEAPRGFPGCMYIYGNGISYGYINNPSLTKERFLSLNQYPNILFYNTGDLAVKNHDDSYSYLGRNDSQIKIRGYRIELKEIESILMESIYIDDVATYLEDKGELQKSLIAFIVPSCKLAKPLLEIIKLQNSDSDDLINLPNGLTISNVNPSETVSLYQEIFTDNIYFKNGIELNDDSIVFDIGANIGLFSLQLGLINPNLTIYAFEPFDILCDCIERNKQIYDLNVKICRVGLSDSSGIKKFSFFDKVTSMSTYHYNENEHLALIKSTFTVDSQEALDIVIREKLNHKNVDCNVETISDQIHRHDLGKIDLLKIDAEGAELDILRGIAENHWDLIKQVVVEVNDVDNNLEKILFLLESKGFNLITDKLLMYKDVNLYMIYASRVKIQNDHTNHITTPQISNKSELISGIMEHTKKKLPEYMQPNQYRVISEIPRTINGKIDHVELERLLDKTESENNSENTDELCNISTINIVKNNWEKVLGRKISSINQNFFESGGSSFLAIQLAESLSRAINQSVDVIDIFNYPTIHKFSKNVFKYLPENEIPAVLDTVNSLSPDKIAIIGIEGVFPCSDNVDIFWDNLISGKDCLSTFTAYHNHSDYNESFVPVAGVINSIYDFDAKHFKIPSSEAMIIDPQQRLLLEVCFLNLVNSRVDLKGHARVGVFASTDQSNYLESIDVRKLSLQDKRSFNYANSRDFAATRIAYKLGLNGPAITINTACSSSLVACAQAMGSLLQNECDIAIVCASSLVLPEILPGYFYEPDGIMSKDGKCRPFDSSASGTVPGSAVASIILKRRTDAIKNNDQIIASIHSYSINNDGNDKASYAAPSISGQKNCLKNIYQKFDGDINSLDYIETHGTGTRIGDAVELMALMDTFQTKSNKKIHLGSVKANIGHAGAASGLCGLIKSALILKKKVIPPQIHFSKWNDLSKLADRYFTINTSPIKLDNGTRYAGISSFGIGGTNVHLLLQSESIEIANEKISLPTLFKNKKYYNIRDSIKVQNIQYRDCANEQQNSRDHLIHLEFIKEFLALIADELGIDAIKLEDNFFD